MSTASYIRIAKLERQLAYTCARSDIASYCIGHIKSGKQWFDIKLACTKGALNKVMAEDVAAAVEYLELIGSLERHPSHAWVHILEMKEELDGARALLAQAVIDKGADATLSTAQIASLTDYIRDLKRKFWYDEVRPIINAIGEISVQEAMDGVERLLGDRRPFRG